ncbi:MAG TPA: acetylornithine transaminase [Gemmatimonadaceae bacterium]|nr:acetylornithine transaminase [Gemmatimonadaceae bacterium]
MTAIAPVPTTNDALLPVYRRLPVEIVGGAGVRLVDAEGRSFLDFTSGIAVNALGYGDPGFADAMRSALESGLVHVSNLYSTAPARALAESLVAKSFASSVFFCNSGAEANEGAFKFARRWARTTRDAAATEIIALRGSFHGRLFGSLAATDRPAYRAPFRPLAPGISIVERDIDSIEGALMTGTVAAVIAEPVQGEGGVRVLSHEFLRALRNLTRAHGVALILDEVQCGLGRTGTFFAYEQAGIEPDLLTLAKPLAGGLPMGAVLLASHVAATIKPGDHATTFGGGPLVATVANYVVDRLSDEDLLAHVRANGAWLGAQLASMADRLPKVRAARGIGYMWGIDVTIPAGQVVGQALEAGLLLVSAGEHTVRLLPPLVATREELAEGLGILEEALQ